MVAFSACLQGFSGPVAAATCDAEKDGILLFSEMGVLGK